MEPDDDDLTGHERIVQVDKALYNKFTEKMPEWISKLITGGQCKTLYVENIDLDLQPTDSEMIRKLCELYSVSLVNVRVNSINDEQNVALGPW